MSHSERSRRHIERFALGVVLLFGAALVVSAQAPTTPLVRGTVVDEQGQPVAGALVRLQGSRHGTVADADGSFRLHVPEQLPEGATVTAAAPGYYNSGTSVLTDPIILRLRRLPASRPGYRWVDPSPEADESHACGHCHLQLYREWAASRHATSAINEQLLDVLYGTGTRRDDAPPRWAFFRDRPDVRGVCAPCHFPQAALGDPAMADPRRLTGVAREGIHCDLCHKVVDVDVSKLPLQHGVHAYRILTPPDHQQAFFGPLPDAISEGDAYAPVYSDARYCAPCHEGLLLGVHVYRTYSEWLRSPAARQGKSCQHCHMPPPTGRSNTAPGRGGIERPREQLASHRFPGGDDPAMLSRALRVDEVRSSLANGQLKVTVTARAGAVGHRVPTGFPQRHFLLLVQAYDRHGMALRRLAGPVLPDVAGWSASLGYELAGKPGLFFGRVFYHRNRLAPFWLADREVDTTLAPATTVRGEFVFAAGEAAAGTTEVILIYRRFYPELEREKGWPTGERILWRAITQW